MRVQLCILVAALALATARAAVWKDCGSKLSSINAVRISGCDDSMKECILKRNTNVSIEVDFTANSAVPIINTVVHGIMMGMPVPFPLPNPNACEGSGLTCPVKSGDSYNYKTVMPVLKAYPKVVLEVKWELQNSKQDDLICLLIAAKIQ